MANKYAQHSKAAAIRHRVQHHSDWLRSCGGKVRYRRRQHAAVVADDCKAKRNIDLRMYKCRHCNGWHLTKKGAVNAQKRNNH